MLEPGSRIQGPGSRILQKQTIFFTKIEFPHTEPLNNLNKYVLQFNLQIQVKQKLNLGPKQKPTEQDFIKTWRHLPSVYNNVVHFLGHPPPQTSPWLDSPERTVEQVEKVEARRQKRVFEEVKKGKYKQKGNNEPVGGRYKRVMRKKEITGAQVRKRRGSENVSEYLQEVENCSGAECTREIPRGT